MTSRIQAGSIRWRGTRGWMSAISATLLIVGICGLFLGRPPAANGAQSSDRPHADAPANADLQGTPTPPSGAHDEGHSPVTTTETGPGEHTDGTTPPATIEPPAAPTEEAPVVEATGSPTSGNGSTDSATTDATPELGTQSYRLRATVDYRAATLDVAETLDWTNLSDTPAARINLSVIPAHAGAFHLSGPVSVDGVTADARFVAYDTNLVVTFPRPISKGTKVHIQLGFDLQVGANVGALGGRLSNERGVLQFGDWFPIWSIEHGFNDVGDSQVTWTADSIVLDLTSTADLGVDAVASSGTLAAGASANHWLFEAHDVRNFAFAVDPDYEVANTKVSCGQTSTEVRAYSFNTPVAKILGRAVRALSTYSERYGCYPYPTFSLAEVGSQYYSMEFPTLVFLGARVAGNAEIVYHEVAHQWWYGMVGSDQMAEPWLDEAFAEFSAQLLTPQPNYCSTRSVASSIYTFSEWNGCDGYIDTIYERGADFLHHLRTRMGDDAFFGALRTIVVKYNGRMVTTDEMLTILRAAAPLDIEDLIAQFGFSVPD